MKGGNVIIKRHNRTDFYYLQNQIIGKTVEFRKEQKMENAKKSPKNNTDSQMCEEKVIMDYKL